MYNNIYYCIQLNVVILKCALEHENVNSTMEIGIIEIQKLN